MDATLEKTGIRLFTGDYCPFCRRVRNELERLGLEYEVVDADADMREEVISLSGQRAIPILTIGDEVLVVEAEPLQLVSHPTAERAVVARIKPYACLL